MGAGGPRSHIREATTSTHTDQPGRQQSERGWIIWRTRGTIPMKRRSRAAHGDGPCKEWTQLQPGAGPEAQAPDVRPGCSLTPPSVTRLLSDTHSRRHRDLDSNAWHRDEAQERLLYGCPGIHLCSPHQACSGLHGSETHQGQSL